MQIRHVSAASRCANRYPFGTPNLHHRVLDRTSPGASAPTVTASTPVSRARGQLRDPAQLRHPRVYSVSRAPAVKVPMRPVGVTASRAVNVSSSTSPDLSFTEASRNPQLPGTDRLHTTRLSPLRRWLTVGAGATTLHLPVVNDHQEHDNQPMYDRLIDPVCSDHRLSSTRRCRETPLLRVYNARIAAVASGSLTGRSRSRSEYHHRR